MVRTKLSTRPTLALLCTLPLVACSAGNTQSVRVQPAPQSHPPAPPTDAMIEDSATLATATEDPDVMTVESDATTVATNSVDASVMADSGATQPVAANSSTPPATASTATPGVPRCRPQQVITRLTRMSYTVPRNNSPEELRRVRREHHEAIRYRTEHYGYFEGFGERSWNPHPPMHYSRATTFMGIPIRVNQQIVPALQCVEAEIQRSCGQYRYRARHLGGIRSNNSFAGGEVSNHVYGIAIDVDPERNPCCGCGTMFRNHPGCTRSAHNMYERMEMPECWVHAFERFGFYWGGNDRVIRDTMHFEFLADPTQILDDGTSSNASSASSSATNGSSTAPANR